jgi:hypothetical protein
VGPAEADGQRQHVVAAVVALAALPNDHELIVAHAMGFRSASTGSPGEQESIAAIMRRTTADALACQPPLRAIVAMTSSADSTPTGVLGVRQDR